MRKFGIEVEYGGTGRDPILSAARELHAEGLAANAGQASYIGHSQTHWIVKADGSVSDGGEMVSPPLDFDDPEQRGQVNRAIAALKRSGATTAQSAGIHVHIDCSDMTGEQIACLARTFTKFEDILFRLASSGWRTIRPGSRSYCRPLTDEQVARLSRAKTKEQVEFAYYGSHGAAAYAGHGHGSRYHALNLHSWFYRGTVEFRLFNSSLNADRIQAYIAICVALVEDARKGNKRSVNKAYRLGGMASGTTNEKSAYHRFQQIVRYECGMSLDDYKLMNRCWKDSVPQAAFSTSAWG